MIGWLLPLLLLAGAAGLWKVGFQKVPLLLVVGAALAALEASGVRRDQFPIHYLLYGLPIFFVCLGAFVLYLNHRSDVMYRKLKATEREAEERAKRNS